ncbi:MAG: hypothetical protein JWQ38_3812 [Flavipsychrobacter sp.]|nr:hypothetical protein [Flavipsychrobacter sp.]
MPPIDLAFMTIGIYNQFTARIFVFLCQIYLKC